MDLVALYWWIYDVNKKEVRPIYAQKATYTFVYNKDMEVIYLYLKHAMYRVRVHFGSIFLEKISEILNF